MQTLNTMLINEQEVYEELYEMGDLIRAEVLQEFRDCGFDPSKRQKWPLVPLARLKKIWEDFMSTGFVRDIKGFENIVQTMTDNTLRLIVNTELCGHTPHDPSDDFADYGYTEQNIDDFGDFILDVQFQWRLSDYAIKPLWALLVELYSVSTPEQKLPLVDRMLNVIHCRGDIAALFVEGGSAGLCALSGRPTDPPLDIVG